MYLGNKIPILAHLNVQYHIKHSNVSGVGVGNCVSAAIGDAG